jgi:hypothetical protein
MPIIHDTPFRLVLENVEEFMIWGFAKLPGFNQAIGAAIVSPPF